MRAGVMDPRGLGATELAYNRSIDALVLNIPCWLLVFIGIICLLWRA